ncbi:hypothetical protein BKA69DRAFT_1144620 [Paraphysoderma sedebokerense]|nr:hypothetical protein BKA69DRAFT_1144620 [Paraphysoderma sedebokerense]
MAVRYFRKAAYQRCKDRKFSEGECEPALCGVFMSKKAWSEIPKVYFRPFKRTDDGELKFIWYDQDETDKAIVKYMEQKGITKKPLIFSPVFRLEGWKMQVAVPSDHTDKLVALCTRDSLAHQLWERYPEDIGRQPVNLAEETQASAGRLFGSHFEGMLDLNYWSRMKIHEGINKDDSGRNERDGEQIELDTIGEGSMPPSD